MVSKIRLAADKFLLLCTNREEQRDTRIQSTYGRPQVAGGVTHLTGNETR